MPKVRARHKFSASTCVLFWLRLRSILQRQVRWLGIVSCKRAVSQLLRYTSDIGDIENPYIHLTNVAIQKKSDDYNKIHGGKWTLSNMRLFLQGTYGHDRANRLFEDMNALIIHSLKACQNVMINDKHCFECYGYDLLIDAQLKPWLLEVNASPSLTTTTTADRVLKTALISDLLDIVMPPGLPVDVAHKGMTVDPASGNLVPIERQGEFELLYDETQDLKGNCRPTLKRLQKSQ
jgi:tubulin polyglutamylase TTLL1